MAGDIKSKYGTAVALTFTSLNSLAGSSTFVAGAGSLAQENDSTLCLDWLFSAKITWSSTAPAAGTYRLDFHAYGALNDTPDYPVDGSGNALGTDTARSFATADDKANSTAFAGSVTLAATASKVYTLSPRAMSPMFNGAMPHKFGIWVTHGVTTASSTPASSGNTVWVKPVLAQYT